jgi:hypothetical protein
LQSNTHSIIFEEWAKTSRTGMRLQKLESREKELTAQGIDPEHSLATLGRLSNLLDSLANQVTSSSREMAQMAGLEEPVATLPPASVCLHNSQTTKTMLPLLGIVEAKASALSAQLQVSEDLIGQLKKQDAKRSKMILNRMAQASRRLFGQTRTVLKKVEQKIRRAKNKASTWTT